jgi:hypothetical protein
VGGAGVVLCGPPSCGASHLAAALARRGHGVLADRLVVVQGDPPAVAVRAAELQLWPDGVLVSEGAGEPVRPGLARRRVRLGAAADPAPLRAVVLLDHQPLQTTRLCPITRAAGVARLGRCLWHRALLARLGMTGRAFSWSTGLVGAPTVVVDLRSGWDPTGDELAVRLEEAVVAR